MDLQLADTLTKLFARQAYPFIHGEAKMNVTGRDRTKFDVTTTEPRATADTLRMLAACTDLHGKSHLYSVMPPLQLAFDLRMKPLEQKSGEITTLAPPQLVRGLTLSFRAGEEDCSWVTLRGATGPTRGPSLEETADILMRAGTRWNKVNFLYKENGSHLRAVR